MFGAHLSTAGGLHNALEAARTYGFDCVQVFTASQLQWHSRPLTRRALAAWHEHRAAAGLDEVVSHDSYLINLASPDGRLRRRSIAAFRRELNRCEALDIGWVVMHPGAHMGAGVDAGVRRLTASLDEIHRDLPGHRAVACLEVTAGAGTTLGARFEQIRQVLDSAAEPARLAVCLDTCHLLAAGYDLTSAAGACGVLDELDAVIGCGLVRVIHMNDSKGPRGGGLDRHAHIGQGHVAAEAFAVLARAFPRTPKIIETPKGPAPDGRPWDVVNVEALRALADPPPPEKTVRRRRRPR